MSIDYRDCLSLRRSHFCEFWGAALVGVLKREAIKVKRLICNCLPKHSHPKLKDSPQRFPHDPLLEAFDLQPDEPQKV